MLNQGFMKFDQFSGTNFNQCKGKDANAGEEEMEDEY